MPDQRFLYSGSIKLTIVRRLIGYLRVVGYVILPSDCVACSRQDSVLCALCQKRCFAEMRQPREVSDTVPRLQDAEGAVRFPVFAAGRYQRELAAVLLAFKQQGTQQLAKVMGLGLSQAIDFAMQEMADHQEISARIAAQSSRAEPIYLVPIPTTMASFRRRGFNPIAEILKHSKYATDQRDGELQVRRVLATRWRWQGLGQKALSRKQRITNIRGRFGVAWRWQGRLAGMHCVVVDDVVTTGATLAEAERVLRREGARVLSAVTVAAVR